MKKIIVASCLALALALPAGAIAKPHPDNADKRAAKAECKVLRGNTDATREGFRTQFRSFAACVRKTAVEEAQEEQTAHKNAAKECKAERTADPEGFATTYGTNGNKHNAFGKCVSKKAKAKEQAADEQDAEDAAEFKNAAKECDALRDADAAAFAEQYGDRPNAFGKCVSSKASEDETETE
jgi:hypothetical protein